MAEGLKMFCAKLKVGSKVKSQGQGQSKGQKDECLKPKLRKYIKKFRTNKYSQQNL